MSFSTKMIVLSKHPLHAAEVSKAIIDKYYSSCQLIKTGSYFKENSGAARLTIKWQLRYFSLFDALLKFTA